MTKIILYFLANIISLMILSSLLTSFEITSLTAASVFLIFLTLLNFSVIPIIKLFTFPINFLTLGLFNGILNIVTIGFAVNWIEGVTITGGFINTLLTIILISFSMSIAQSIVGNFSE